MNGDSVSKDNKYAFHCSTTKRDVRFTVCAFMRAKHWRGEVIPYNDCRVAMIGSKCPVVRMLAKERREGSTRDNPRQFYDTEGSVVHRIPADIAEDLNRVILVPSQSRGISLTEDEQIKLFGSKIGEIPAVILAPPEINSRKNKKPSIQVNNKSYTRSADRDDSGSTIDIMEGLDDEGVGLADVINGAIQELDGEEG